MARLGGGSGGKVVQTGEQLVASRSARAGEQQAQGQRAPALPAAHQVGWLAWQYPLLLLQVGFCFPIQIIMLGLVDAWTGTACDLAGRWQ